MSNLALCQIYIDGAHWQSVEQYFQAARFSDAEYRETIRAVPADIGDASRYASLVHGAQVWHLGQSTNHALVEHFRPLETVYVATRAKFEQSYIFRDDLLRTKGNIEAAPNDGGWQRLHSLILERIREELRHPDVRDEARLQELRDHFKAEGFDEEIATTHLLATVHDHGMLGRQHRLIAMMLDGRSVEITALGTDTVLTAKSQLAQTNGISSCRIEFVLGGTTLRDMQTIAQLGAPDNTIISVIIRPPIPADAQQRNADLHDDLMAKLGTRPED